MYKCCIFDLDGTLINSIKAIAYSCNLTLKKYNLGPIDEDTYKILVGDGYKKLIERALIHCGDTSLENYEEKLQLLKKHQERLDLIQRIEDDISSDHKSLEEYLELLRKI